MENPAQFCVKNNSVLAGSLKKKLGLTIESEKDDTRGRTYKLGN